MDKKPFLQTGELPEHQFFIRGSHLNNPLLVRDKQFGRDLNTQKKGTVSDGKLFDVKFLVEHATSDAALLSLILLIRDEVVNITLNMATRTEHFQYMKEGVPIFQIELLNYSRTLIAVEEILKQLSQRIEAVRDREKHAIKMKREQIKQRLLQAVTNQEGLSDAKLELEVDSQLAIAQDKEKRDDHQLLKAIGIISTNLEEFKHQLVLLKDRFNEANQTRS